MKNIFSKIAQLTLSSCLLVMVFASVGYGQCPAGQGQVCVTMDGETFEGENSWILWDATAGATLAGVSSNQFAGVQCANTTTAPALPIGGWDDGATVMACVPVGNTIELHTYESFGDGWQNGVVTIDVCEDNSAGSCVAAAAGIVVFAPPADDALGPDDNDLSPGTADGGIDCSNIANNNPSFLGGTFTLVEDLTLPACAVLPFECEVTAICKDTITVSLDGTGCIELWPTSVNGGSTSTGTITDLELDINKFCCEDKGPDGVIVTLTVFAECEDDGTGGGTGSGTGSGTIQYTRNSSRSG